MLKILVADDHPVVVEGWERVAAAAGPCTIVPAHSPLAAFAKMRTERPDLVVLDLSFGAGYMAGLTLLRRMRRFDTETPVLVFSMHRSALIARQALEAGATGFVNKDEPTEQIRAAFAAVLDGGFYLAPDMAQQIALLSRPRQRADTLTQREVEILGYLAEGCSYRQIADRICLSYKTVANISYSLRAKLGARSLAELVIKGVQYFASGAEMRRPDTRPTALATEPTGAAGTATLRGRVSQD